jgi:hypothetical protein
VQLRDPALARVPAGHVENAELAVGLEQKYPPCDSDGKHQGETGMASEEFHAAFLKSKQLAVMTKEKTLVVAQIWLTGQMEHAVAATPANVPNPHPTKVEDAAGHA